MSPSFPKLPQATTFDRAVPTPLTLASEITKWLEIEPNPKPKVYAAEY